MNRAIFGPPRVPAWMPFALSGVAASAVYIAVGGGEAAIGPAFATLAGAVTLFGGLHYELARQMVIHQTPAEPRPEPPEGFRPMPVYASDVQVIPGKVWLQMPGRDVPLYITRPQHLTLAAYIGRGEKRILHELTSKAHAFRRGEVDDLRRYCLAHDLATKRGREVWLVDEAAAAIVAATTRPAGTIRARLTKPDNTQQVQFQQFA